jgi:protein-S-isoprenylcysteine O-methyltransferase Ste14
MTDGRRRRTADGRQQTKMKTETKMIFGYIVGGLLVLVIVPSILYLISHLLEMIFRMEITGNPMVKWILFVPLLLTGLVFGIWSIVIQNVVGQGGPVEVADIEISPKTKNLVVTGPYRYTRNPMLFGTFLMYLAAAVMVNSCYAVGLVLLFILFMLTVVVKKEEKRLSRDFGDQYEKYRRKTSRFIPWFPKQ